MSYLFWLSVAVATLIIEILSLSFFFIFFAFAGFVLAVLTYAGLLPDFVPQLIVFALVALGSLWLLRDKLRHSFAATGLPATDAEKIITLTAPVPANGEATIEYQGSNWTAVNPTPTAFTMGERAVIDRTDGVRLVLRRL